jgi:cell volume regulation protein A
MHTHHEIELRILVSVVADVMVLFVFIVLGSNLPWGTMADHFLPALAVLATLILIARPITVLACLLPDRRGRWTRQELIFIAWTRETGVVPAAVAGIVVSMGVRNSELVVTTVALAIIVTLAVQATTKRWLAHRLALVELPPDSLSGPPELLEAPVAKAATR